MIKLRKALLLLVVMIVAASCATTSGRRVAEEDLQKIEKGKTTQAQVIEILGEPETTKTTRDGMVLVYAYSEARPGATSYVPYVGSYIGKTKTENQVVYIFVDEDKVVREIQVEKGSSEGGKSF